MGASGSEDKGKAVGFERKFVGVSTDGLWDLFQFEGFTELFGLFEAIVGEVEHYTSGVELRGKQHGSLTSFGADLEEGRKGYTLSLE